MGNSVYLAKLIGPVMLAVAAGLFANGKHYRTMAEEALRSTILIYLTGLISLTAGLAIVLAHNVWVPDWRILITLLGWLAVLSGVVRVVHPQTTQDVGRRMLNSPHAMTIAGAFWVGVLAARRLRDWGEGRRAIEDGHTPLALAAGSSGVPDDPRTRRIRALVADREPVSLHPDAVQTDVSAFRQELAAAARAPDDPARLLRRGGGGDDERDDDEERANPRSDA